MTVGELIEELKKCNKEADVYRLNEATDYYSSDTTECITNVRENKECYYIVIE